MQTDANEEQPLPSHLVSPRINEREESITIPDPSNILIKDETFEDMTSDQNTEVNNLKNQIDKSNGMLKNVTDGLVLQQ